MTRKFKVFNDHMKETGAANHEDFVGKPNVKVRSKKEFDKMKKHIEDHYRGIRVKHSFMLESGMHIDCVPIENQPALRAHKLAEAPSVLPEHGGQEEVSDKPKDAQYVTSSIGHGQKDTSGNVQDCPTGHVPLLRVDLDMLTRFETLEHMFQKGPAERDKELDFEKPATGVAAHNYAHAYQFVNNLGGSSWLNVWKPVVSPQIFSLSQHWYVNGSWAAGNLQTVEGGWQVYPQKYGTTNPCLFIYWSDKNYAKGNYNLDSSAFVMYSNVWTPGGTLLPVSTTGGSQMGITMHWQLWQGNWWLGINNGTFTWVGYYPGTLWSNGPITKNASQIDFGGETVGSNSYPQMGSGAFSSTGWEKAAFQSSIRYINTSTTWANPSLTLSQPTPNWYTITASGSNKFYFGGPGGS